MLFYCDCPRSIVLIYSCDYLSVDWQRNNRPPNSILVKYDTLLYPTLNNILKNHNVSNVPEELNTLPRFLKTPFLVGLLSSSEEEEEEEDAIFFLFFFFFFFFSSGLSVEEEEKVLGGS